MAWREIPFYIFWKSRFHLIDGYGREGRKFILDISRNGYGKKVSFCRQGKYFGDSQYTWVSIHRPFHSQVTEGERGAGKEKVLGLENKGGIPHGYQSLRSIPPTAEPVLIHSGDDTQHFPSLEAQLVRSCSSVVTESPDCPVGLRRAGF